MRTRVKCTQYRRVLAVRVLGLLALSMLRGCTTTGTAATGSAFGRSGTPWTIRCLEVAGPNQRQRVEQVAATLRRTPDVRPSDVNVSYESDGVARLYYGTYMRRVDRATGTWSTPEKMREDLAIIRELGDPSGARYFTRAVPVMIPMPDVGNPAWKLTNVRARYSLQVAVFEPKDDFHEFKQAAADYCAYLRGKGYEAYYHHASASSMVTVGTFGPDAVRAESPVRVYYSPEVVALQRDELLKYNLVNGAVVRVKTPTGDIPVASALVEIPHAALEDSW